MAKEKIRPRFVKRSHKLREWAMSRTTGWRYEQSDPTFPKPIQLGPLLWVYDVDECDRWERSKLAATKTAEAA